MPIELKNQNLLISNCYINGNWLASDTRQVISVHNPANGEHLAEVPALDEKETQQAIEAAHKAWDDWRNKLAKERANIMREWSRIIVANKEDIALLMTLEMGKPISQSRGEVEYAASFIDWYAAEAERVMGETIMPTKAGRRETVWKEPVGVTAAITPWNFPAAMITRKVAPAIAAGCTAIVKPAEACPLTALALAKCAEEANLPAGVLNVVTGDAATIGKVLTESPIVRKFSFTGSTEVGKKLYAQCAGTIKNISLELGGNAPFIVFDDADLDAAIEGLKISKFRNNGQTCVCANRILVQDGIYDTFRKRVVELAESLKLANPQDDTADIGCLVDETAFNNVKALVNEAIQDGARLVTGGDADSTLGKPYFSPTVLDNVEHHMRICQEEIFGPVATLIRFHDEEEALKMANDTPYGLAAYFYTQNYKRIFRVGEGLEYGMVGANLGHVSSAAAPFGGYKQSGIGREASHYGIEEFLETKYLAIGGF